MPPAPNQRIQQAGRDLDVNSPADRASFLNAVKGPLNRSKIEEFKRGWCLHRGFGACCDPAVFHLSGVWRLREDPTIHRIAVRQPHYEPCNPSAPSCRAAALRLLSRSSSYRAPQYMSSALQAALTGSSHLWVDLNRSIQKLPGEGEKVSAARSCFRQLACTLPPGKRVTVTCVKQGRVTFGL